MVETVPTVEEVALWLESGKPYQHCLTLPDSFEEYWNHVAHGDVRTQWRKADKRGYTVRRTVEPRIEDIGDIWGSWEGEKKQSREVLPHVQHLSPRIGPWRIQDCWPFAYYPNTQGLLDFWESERDEMTFAYMELAIIGEDAGVFGLLGHKCYLKDGIMKHLFVEVIKDLISRKIKRLYYLKRAYTALLPEKAFFVRDLGFK